MNASQQITVARIEIPCHEYHKVRLYAIRTIFEYPKSKYQGNLLLIEDVLYVGSRMAFLLGSLATEAS